MIVYTSEEVVVIIVVLDIVIDGGRGWVLIVFFPFKKKTYKTELFYLVEKGKW